MFISQGKSLISATDKNDRKKKLNTALLTENKTGN